MEVSINRIKKAIEESNLDFLKQFSAHINWNDRITDQAGETLILYALTQSSIELCDYIISKGGDIYSLNDENENAIHSIVFSGSIEKLNKYKNKYELDVNAKSKDGTCPLLLATLLDKHATINVDKHEIINGLLSFDEIDVNTLDNELISSLHMAAQQGDLETVKKLVEKGAELFQKTEKGNLAISLAANNEHYDVMEYLFQAMRMARQV